MTPRMQATKAEINRKYYFLQKKKKYFVVLSVFVCLFVFWSLFLVAMSCPTLLQSHGVLLQQTKKAMQPKK